MNPAGRKVSGSGLADMAQERLGSLYGIVRLGDGPADHDVVGSSSNGVLGRHDPLLVVGGAAGKADARRDNEEARPGRGTDGGGLLA
jgi:hypothetical protein